MGFVPQQTPSNARGNAIKRIVSDIVLCENQIHQFFQDQKIGNLLKHSNIHGLRVPFTMVFTGRNLSHSLEGIIELYNDSRASAELSSLPIEIVSSVYTFMSFFAPF